MTGEGAGMGRGRGAGRGRSLTAEELRAREEDAAGHVEAMREAGLEGSPDPEDAAKLADARGDRAHWRRAAEAMEAGRPPPAVRSGSTPGAAGRTRAERAEDTRGPGR